ncbi:MAG: hypothetical protein AB1714_17845 [Acidobacteriota bacterium]
MMMRRGGGAVIVCAMMVCCVTSAARSVSADEIALRFSLRPGLSESVLMEKAADGGFLLAGSIGKAYHERAWCMKLDAFGGTQWRAMYGDGGHAYNVRGLQETRDGGAVVAGLANVGESDLSHGWVMKIAPGGAIEWQRGYSVGECGGFEDVKVVDGGRLVLTGGTVYSQNLDATENIEVMEVWLVQLDTSGEPLWSKVYLDAGEGRCVDLGADGGFVVVATNRVLRVDGHGEITWARRYDGPGLEVFRGIRKTKEGGYLVWGENLSRVGEVADGVILKLDPSGNPQWQTLVGGRSEDWLFSLDQADTGAFVLAGTTSSFESWFRPWLLKIADDGTAIWQRIYSGPAILGSAQAVRAIPGGGFITAGVLSGNKITFTLHSFTGELTACPKLYTRVQGGSAPIEMTVRDLECRASSLAVTHMPTKARRLPLTVRTAPLCERSGS